jgi:hypothetical protein
MRYRREDANEDYIFGPGSSFMVDTPEAVAQAVKTRLRLYVGEWFLDTREGLNLDLVLGYGTQMTRDREVQRVITGTTGVRRILSYSSDATNRAFKVTATVETIYGITTINEAIR